MVRPSRAHAVAYLAFMSALLAVGIDIMLPAFDEIREEFDLAAGSGSVTPIVTVYFIAMGATQLVHGPLSDRFGRKAVIFLGIGLYAVGCIGTLVAPSIGWILTARVVWGAGAATFAVIYGAIARDLYSGDDMARVVSVVNAVFLIGPILTPLLGEALVETLPWRSVVVASLTINVVLMFWTLRFPETLAPADRRPFSVGTIARSVRRVVRHRSSFFHLLSTTFLYAPFFVFLASSQPIMDEIYGRADEFAFWFAAGSIPSAAALLVSQRLVGRHGLRSVLVPAAGGMMIIAIAWMAVTLAADGTPSFWAWLALMVAVNSLILVQSALHISAALDPMGDIAGVAAALVGVFGSVGGAVLASPINQAITTTVTPMVLCYVGYGAAAVACTAIALTASKQHQDDATAAVANASATPEPA